MSIQATDEVWVQTQAPAGNWVDSTGFHFDATSPDDYHRALKEARQHAAWLQQSGKTARVIRKYEEVLQ